MNSRDKNTLSDDIESQISLYLNIMLVLLNDRNFDPEQFKQEMRGFIDYFLTISAKDLTPSATVSAALIYAQLAEAELSNAKVIDQEMVTEYLQPALALNLSAQKIPLKAHDAVLHCMCQGSLAVALSMLGDYDAAEQQILEALKRLQNYQGADPYDVFMDILQNIHIALYFHSRDKKPWSELYNALCQGNDFKLQSLGIDIHELLKEDAKYLFHMKVVRASIGLVLKHYSQDYFPNNSIADQLKQPFCLAQFKEWEAKLGERIAYLESLQGLLSDNPSVMFALMQKVQFLQEQVRSLENKLGEQHAKPVASNTNACLFPSVAVRKVVQEHEESVSWVKHNA